MNFKNYIMTLSLVGGLVLGTAQAAQHKGESFLVKTVGAVSGATRAVKYVGYTLPKAVATTTWNHKGKLAALAMFMALESTGAINVIPDGLVPGADLVAGWTHAVAATLRPERGWFSESLFERVYRKISGCF